MARRSTCDRPRWWECLGLLALVVVIPLFGVLVVWRSAYMNARHTDFEVYARAGWAVRTGADIYQVTDTHGLHYCYPPPFAVLMAPLAEPPAGIDRAGYLPFGASIAIWYVVSVVCLFASAHVIASAVGAPGASRRNWWELRIWPVVLTLPAAGNNLSHGQVNLLLLLLISAMIAAAVRGQAVRAGLWLAGAAALKVIPAYLTLVALWRRDARWAVAAAVGFVLITFGLPALVLGPATAVAANRKFVEVMIAPALAETGDASRAREMFHVLKTDNQSTQAVLHAWRHWPNPDAPPQPDTPTRAVHWLVGLCLTVATLWSARGRTLQGGELVVFIGALAVVMLVVSPMCHLHYYCLALPLIVGLLHCEGVPTSPRLAVLLGLHIIGGAIPLLFESIRNLGFAPLTTLPLWLYGVAMLNRGRVAAVTSAARPRVAA